MTPAGWVLAHQGGWDEVGLVLTPIVLFAGLLWLANRRATALGAAPTPPSEDDGPDADERDQEEPDPPR
ncbi:MAG: hypothetical protein ACR2JF_16465 [Iamia sp.]